MKQLLLFISLCIGISTYANENKSALKGRVLDENGLALPGASVFIDSLQIGTTTDLNGNYIFLNLPSGKAEIKVTYLGYQTMTKGIDLQENETEFLIFNLKPVTNELQEVIVKSSLQQGQARALNKQKNNDNITNVVAADQIGKFPDNNIGDALKRISGIAMQNDQGEARDIIIRGLAPQLNSVTLNGERIPSAEGDNRRIQLDLIPSDMIQVIEVNKAVTPDMEADAIGGSVNLVTRSAPAGFRASLTAASGLNPVRDEPLYNFSGVIANRFFNDKLGVVVSGSLNSNEYGSDNVEFEWDGTDVIKEHDIRTYDVKRVRRSISANLNFNLDNNNTLFFKSILSQRDDQENRYRLRYKFDDDDSEYEISRQTKGGIDNSTNDNTRLERQKMYKFSFGGEHILFNSIEAVWKANWSKASEERPNERYITYESKIEASNVSQLGLNTEEPYFNVANGLDNDASQFELDEISEERRYTEEKNLGFNVDFRIPLSSGKNSNSLKIGYKYQQKEKLRDNNFFEFDTDDFSQYNLLSDTPNSSQSNSDFLAGTQYQAGTFARNSLLGGLSLQNGELVLDEFLPENYDAEENINAAYVMFKQEFGDKFSFIAGARFENTDIDYLGYQVDVETAESVDDAIMTTGSRSYSNFLPNVQLKYQPSKNTVLRLAYTNTLARPNYYDLVPYENINSDDEEAEFGNPNLDPSTSLNLDLMAEHYFKSVGIISGGVFYKNIDDFIYTSVIERDLTVNNATSTYEISQPFNGGTAMVYGFEMALQRRLNFLPGVLKNLNVYINYTYTDSETDGITGREDGLELAGAVKNMFNGSLSYQSKKLTLRTSLNFADDYIDEYDGDAVDDRYYDEQLFLDFNGSYAFTPKLRLFAEVKNITNQPLRFYQGRSNQTMQAEFYDFNWNIGLKYNF